MRMPLYKRVFWRRVSVAVLVTMIVATYAILSYSRVSLPYLETRILFKYYLHKEARELDDQSRSGFSNVYYFTSYYLNGLLSAVEGTGDEALLRRALRLMDNMVSTAQDIELHDHHYHVWRPFVVTADSAVAKPNMHYSFQACIPLARAAAIIENNPRFKSKYDDHARRYIDFVDSSIFNYWIEGQFKGEIPWAGNDHFPIWNDNGCNLAINATYLYRATGHARYKDIALRMGKHFQTKLVPYRTGWVWESQTIRLGTDTDNTPGSVGNQAGVPDTSHTNREALLMISQYECGLLFTTADLDRMAATFVDVLWNQDWRNPRFSNYLNGTDKPYRVYKSPGLNGSVYHGWAMFGGYSPMVQKILLKTLEAIVMRRAKHNSALERNATSYGAHLAITGHVLRNFALTWSKTPQSPWENWWRSGTNMFFDFPPVPESEQDLSKS